MKIINNLLFGICVLFLSTSAAFAGWASGGGEVVKDGGNPWFIQNTKRINECILVDPEHFHVPGGDLASLWQRVDEAVAYWQQEFKHAWSVGNVVQEATQTFVHAGFVVKGGRLVPGAAQNCPADTDITFQFGYLDAQQLAYFNASAGGVGKYIAAAVRTSYDPVHLRGRGFIYVAADSGPLQLKGSGLTASPWKLGNGYLVTAALQHELGHVFGVPHKGTETIMAADFLERALSRDAAPYFAQHLDQTPFFKISGSYMIRDLCADGKDGHESGIRAGWRQFLQIPPDHVCYRIFLDGDHIDFSSSAAGGEYELRGTLKFAGQETFMWEEAVRLYLPDEQTVLKKIPSGAGSKPWILGPMIVNVEHHGTYTSVDGKTKRTVFLTLSPTGIGFAMARFSVEIDGQWHWNLDFEY